MMKETSNKDMDVELNGPLLTLNVKEQNFILTGSKFDA